MEINFSDHLTSEEMKSIAERAFKDHCVCQFTDNKNVERIIGNTAFNSASEIVSSHYGDDLQSLVNEKVIKAINKIDTFMIFKAADAWDRDSTKGFEMLKLAVSNNEQLINEKAASIIRDANVRDAEEYVMDILRESIAEKLFTNSEK